MTISKNTYKYISFFVLCILVFFTYFPMYFMIVSSLKTNGQIFNNYFGIGFPLHFEYYIAAFNKVSKYLMNSVVVSVSTVVGVCVVSVITAYVFARKEFHGKKILFSVILAFLLVPGIITLIPGFIVIKNLGFVNSPLGCILPYIAWGQITFIYILRSFIEGIPNELFETAKIDGASDLRIMWSIVIPLSKAVVISLALYNFLITWNDFVWPLLVLPKEEMKTISVGLYSFMDVQQTQYGLMFAGFIIAAVPSMLLLSLNMKHFISGITSGAIKG